MPKRKCSPLKDQRGNKTSTENKKREGCFTPERTGVEKGDELEEKINTSRRETPGRAVKRKADKTYILPWQGTIKKYPAGKSAIIQQGANVSAEKNQTGSIKMIVKEPKESKMVVILKRIEMNVVETLRQHSVTLPDHDLTMLHNLRKLNIISEQSCITEIGSVDPKPGIRAIVPVVSRDKGHAIVLTDPPIKPLEKPDSNHFNCQATIEKSVPAVVTHVTLQSNTGESKNKFLENLALTQIVPTRTISNLSSTKRNLRISPAKKCSTSPKKMVEVPPKTVPSVPNAKPNTTNMPLSSSYNVGEGDLPNGQISPRNVRIVSKVRIIDLPGQDLQNLQNNKSHIQYMASKKDPSPQEVSLLRKLLLHQKKILDTGKLVMPIPGKTVKGIPFLSGACMYVVQNRNGQVIPDTGQTSQKVVMPVPCVDLEPSGTVGNRSNCSLNLPQIKHSATEKLLELATNNKCDYVFPDTEKTVCHSNSCVLQVALLKSELNQKSIALESCNSELANTRAELGKANEYISNLRAQLEENTHTLCSYLAANSHVN